MKYFLTLFIGLLPVLCLGQGQTLNEYIQLAKENSAILKDFQNQILSNRIDSQILKATTKTQLNFISNEMYAPVIKGWGYDEAITNIAQVSGMVQATKSFLSKGNLAAQYRKIALQNQSLRDTLFLSIKDLVKTITEQYITAYGDQLVMDYSKELYELLKKEEEILKKLAQSNVIKQTEFLAFNITMQQQELTYLQAQIQYNVDYLTLNYLAGIVDTTINRVEEPKLEDSLPQDFYNSVFLQRYVTDSLRIVNERRLIDYSYRPTFNAFTDAGFNSSLQNTPYKNIGFSIGVNIKMPLYDAHQKSLKYQKLDIEERTRQTNKIFFINQYNQQVTQLYIQLNATDQLFEKIKQQVNYTKTLITAYEKLLETSDVKITDFVTAITNYLNAQNSYRQNLISRLKIINQINYWYR
ncbi:MAG TPA: TolC family protein [Chitinophagaceae bacterium]|jgi:outer membrane protein TolC|nr:TolC family protein [Chitinophagaceae bacterium]